ncbi:MAG TPA: hypothetical protein VK530_04735 [Candidatus Acidoferrum sp.]|nr:hypothetical protein [Candidatus Acidoferrum sp.]
MKKLLQWSVLALAMTLFQRAQAAPYTNYMNEVSNVIAFAYGVTAELPREHKQLGKALKAFNKSSTSVAGDYKIFIGVATALLPLQGTAPAEIAGPLGVGSTNAFNSFVLEAQAQVGELSARLAAVTPLQPLRRAASNQVAAAVRSLITAGTTTDLRIGILSVGLALNKLVVARKLTEKAEAKQGFALDSLEGNTFTHVEPSETATILFVDHEIFSPPVGEEGDYGTYTYTRNGLSTATLVLVSQPEGNTTTVKLRFTALDGGASEGTFTYRFVGDGQTDSGKGSFSTQPQPE